MWLPSFLHFLCFPSEQAQLLAHRQAELRLSYHSPSLSMEASWLQARDSTCELSALGKGPATGPFSGIARVGSSHLVPSSRILGILVLGKSPGHAVGDVCVVKLHQTDTLCLHRCHQKKIIEK